MEPNRHIAPLDEDLHRQECGYNLRGLRRCLCPECGTTFGVKNLRRYHDTTARSWRAIWSRVAPLTLLALHASWGLSIAVQALGYSDRAGQRSRAWIVHDLPAPWHYIMAAVVVPSLGFGAVVVILFCKNVSAAKRTGMSKSGVVGRIATLSFLAFVLLAFQFSCLHTCATIGD